MPKKNKSGKSEGGGATRALFAPDAMVQAGLADDIDGRIVSIRYVPWDYNGNLDHFVLGVAVEIEPDEGDVFTQTYSAGDLKNWVPSQDGEEPAGGDLDEWQKLGEGSLDLEDDEKAADGDYAGPFAIQVGRQAGLPNSSNFAFFARALADAKFNGWADDGDLRALEGLYAHWNRVPPPTRRGLQGEGEKKASDVLVVTEILEMPGEGKKGSAKKSKPASKGKAKSKAKEADEGDEDGGEDEGGMDAKVREVVRVALGKAEDATMGRKEVEKVVRKAFKGRELVEAFKLVKDDEWMAGQDDGGWIYDDEEETLTLLDE